MRKGRGGLTKAVTVFLALLVALGLTGMGYSVWSDTLSISGMVQTGTWGVQVTKGTCSDPGVIGCSGSGGVLTVTLTNAPDGSYYCWFDVKNTGNIPIKIQSIGVSGLPLEVTVDSIEYVGEGDQIDAYGIKSGKVNFTVAVDDGQVTGTFTVTFVVVPWNQYVP